MTASERARPQRAHERAPEPRASAGPRAASVDPPAYGIGILDDGESQAAPPTALPTLFQRTHALPGERLPDDLAASLGAHAGADLSPIRIHTDPTSAAAAQRLGARAFTVRSDIHFAAGAYAPASPGGRHLIAHEVAHCLQQRQGPPALQNQLAVGQPGEPAELEADAFATAFLEGRPHPIAARPDLPAISCARETAAPHPAPAGRQISLTVSRGQGVYAQFGPLVVAGREVTVSLRMGLKGTVAAATPEALPPAPARQRGHKPPPDPARDIALEALGAAVRAASVAVSGSRLTIDVAGHPLQIDITDKGAATRSVLSTHQAAKQSLVVGDLAFHGSLDADVVTTVAGTGAPEGNAEGSTEALGRVSFLGDDARLVDEYATDKQGKSRLVHRHDVAAADPAAVRNVLAIKTVLEQQEAAERAAVLAAAADRVAARNEKEPPKRRLAGDPLAAAQQAEGQAVLDKLVFPSRQFAAAIDTEAAALRLLEWMRPWFKSDANTVAHFSKIRRVKGQHNLLAHESLARRLEAVQKEMVERFPEAAAQGRAYPSTSVGWSFRGEIQLGASQGHKHMHKIGMAVDFDAHNLPMMNPGTTRALVKAVTGRSNALFQPPTAGAPGRDWTDYGARRRMIRSLEKSTEEDRPDKQQQFLDDLAAAIDSTAAASAELQASIDRGAFLQLRERWADVSEMPDGDEKTRKLAEVNAAIDQLIRPWLDAVKRYQDGLAARAQAEYGVDITRDAPDIGPLRPLLKPLRALAVRLTKKPGTKPGPRDLELVAAAAARAGKPAPDPLTGPALLELADTLAAALKAGEDELARRKKAKDLDADRWFAVQLADKLLHDRDYLFGKLSYKKKQKAKKSDPDEWARSWSESVDQPGAGQILTRGWFRVAEPGAAASTPSKEFMLAMARHGFELGGAWGSSDSMHYEVAVE